MGNIIANIALSGGPKAGKTVLKEEIKKMIEEEFGMKVLIVSETATQVIESGFIPAAKPADGNKKGMKLFRRTNIAFQKIILDLQLAKEEAIKIAAQAEEEDVVIICDRGAIDNLGYLMKNLGKIIGKIIFEMFMKPYRLTKEKLLNRYDIVVFLETSAKKFDFDQNIGEDKTKRIESGNEEAIAVNNAVKEAWDGHKNFVEIKATDTIEEKSEITKEYIRNLINEKLVNQEVQKLIKKR